MAGRTELRSDCADSDDESIVEHTHRSFHFGSPPRPAVVKMVPLMVSDATDLMQLLDSPDTVTHLLENLTGELVVAEVVRQYSVMAGQDNSLGVAAGHAMTHRISVLKGRNSDEPYLYAESTFVPERLPEVVSAQLERTSDPIGRVLVANGLGMKREPLPQPEGAGADVPSTDVELASEIVWSRAYRLTIDGQPVFVIHEWFLRSVLDALDRHARR